MSNICLTPTPNLRCQSLSWLESVVLLVPPALEVIFSAGLMVNKRNSRSKIHFLLGSEGLMYFILTLTDFTIHQAPSIKGSLSVFKGFDILIGTLAAIPLVLFLAYLYLFVSRELIPTLPNRFQEVVKYTLLLCIPIIVTFGVMASFVNLAYRDDRGIIAVGFTNESLRIFFTTIALVIFTAFQAISFCLAFFRTIMALINQRRIDSARRNNEEAHIFNGVGWIALGIKLGAIETLIGIIFGQFGHALTRRILRMLGRASLVIGMLKGLDMVQEFSMFDVRERKPPGRSQLKALISVPVDNTFRQVGGYSYEASYEPPMVVQRSRPLSAISPSAREPMVFSVEQVDRRTSDSEIPSSNSREKKFRSRMVEFPVAKSPFVESSKTEMSAIESPNLDRRDALSTPDLRVDTRNLSVTKEQRVIVRYRRGRAPTLELQRLSRLWDSLPSPLTATSVGGPAARSPRSPDLPKSAMPTSQSEQRLPNPYSTTTEPWTESPLVGVPLPDRARVRPQHRRTLSSCDELLDKGARKSSILLPRQTYNGGDKGSKKNLELLQALAMQFPGSKVQEFMRREQATGDTDIQAEGANMSRSASQRTIDSRTSLIRRGSSVKRKPVPAYDDLDSGAIEEALSMADEMEEVEEPEEAQSESKGRRSFPFSAPSARRSFVRESKRPTSRSSGESGSGTVRRHRVHSAPSKRRESGHVLNKGSVGVVAGELDDAWKEVRLGKIKSVGSAPRRSTPTPSHSTFDRSSMMVEWHTADNDEMV